MASLKIRDDVIWIKHIDAEAHNLERLKQLNEFETVRLEIDGTVGTWQKMANYPNGTTTPGLRAVGETSLFWKRLQARRGEVVSLKFVREDDGYLASLYPLLSEWTSEEDEKAFHDL